MTISWYNVPEILICRLVFYLHLNNFVGGDDVTSEIMIDSRPFMEHSGIAFVRSGKSRDSYDVDDRLLIVATDRVSTYDAIHPNGIPDKGWVLSQLSAFWFLHPAIAAVCPNHFLSLVDNWFPSDEGAIRCPEVAGRTLLVRRAETVYPVECIVRGYITGSAWAEYSDSGTVSGQSLPAGILESEQFPEPLFTPTTKAQTGHDEVVSWEQFVVLVGDLQLAEKLRDWSVELYIAARDYALRRGVIIADTKFEFGEVDGEPTLVDEVLTPDSSRFWAAELYEPGWSQEPLDKQIVRNWAAGTGWDKTPPAPSIPPEVQAKAGARYMEIFERLTGLPAKV